MSPSGREPSPREPSPVGPMEGAALILAAIFLVSGLVWPHMAGPLLRAFVLTLVLLWIGYRAYNAALPAAALLDHYSPFDGVGERRDRVLPDGLWDLARLIRNADDPKRSARSIVPAQVQEILRDDATRRLAEGYGLNLFDVRHHPRIRERLSARAWLLVAPTGAEGAAPKLAAAHEAVTLSQLDAILDELETL